MTYNANTDCVQSDNLMAYIYVPTTATTHASALTSAEVIAFGTSCSLEISQDEIDSSNKMACRFKTALPGKVSWSVNTDSLYTRKSGAMSYDSLLEKMLDGEMVGVAIAQPTEAQVCSEATYAIDTNNVVGFGTAMIASLSLTADNGGIASCSISLTGSGELMND